jgi:hypothetical protein
MTPRYITFVVGTSVPLALFPVARAQDQPAPTPQQQPGITILKTPPDPTDGVPSIGGPYAVEWFTIDGGGITFSSGGVYSMGSTVGQPDTGFSFGGCYEFNGGFWGLVADPPTCYANCDHSQIPPVLNTADFTCFLQRYAAGDCYANCDESNIDPVVNTADFTCFLQKYAAGCS